MKRFSLAQRALLAVKKYSALVGTLGIALSLLAFYASSRPAEAVGNTYTICDSGCDFASLTEAIAFGVTGDTLQIVSPFTFDDTQEDDSIFFPADLTLECEAGVTYGDAAQDIVGLWPASNNTIQDCTFENIYIDTTFGNNVDILRNTFSSAAASSVTLTGTDGFQILDNIGIQKVQAQAPKNGLIDGNQFECRFNDNCINLVNDTPDTIVISNNTITNYNVASGGDFVSLQKGTNIQFINNTVQSVPMNDNYVTMVTLATGDYYVANNYIIFPDKGLGATNGTWGINFRIADDPLSVTVEHNTIVHATAQTGGGDAGIGLFDDGSHTNVPVTLDINYNLFYQGAADAPSGTGIRLQYTLGSADVTLTDSFNGFYATAFPLGDSTGTYTALNANTLYSDPLFRQENVDTSDDYYLNPISRYLDADGTKDVGAYGNPSGADRVSVYHIDDDCTVDYTTCFSNTSSVLQHSIKTGDDVTIAAGLYGAVTLDYRANNFSIAGAGTSTIIDAGGTGSALTLDGISSAAISGMTLTGSASTITTTYELSLALFDFGGNSYNQTSGILGSDDVVLLMTNASCGVLPIFADNTDVTAVVGAATDNWHIALIDLGGAKITIMFPGQFVSNATEAADYILNECGAPITVDAFITGAFTVASGEYTYNTAAVSGAGASLMAGVTDPATLTRLMTVPAAAGLLLEDVDDTTFTGLTIDSNTLGLHADAASAGNNLVDSVFSNNTGSDLYSLATGTNKLTDTVFSLGDTVNDGSGIWEVYYTVRGQVTRTRPNGPVDGAQMEVRNAGNVLVATLVTDGTGYTPYSAPLLAYTIDDTGPYSETDGGYNPFKFTITATGLPMRIITENLDTPKQLIQSQLRVSSGGGGGSVPDNISFSINDDAATTASRSVTLSIDAQNASAMVISNGASFDGVDWEAYSGEPRQWQLTDGAGVKQVCIMVRSENGNLSPIVCDDIELRYDIPVPTERHVYYERYELARLLAEPLTISSDKSLPTVSGGACVAGSLIKLPNDGNPATQDDTTVYYCGTDGKRYVFPNEQTYFTWYADFSGVVIVSPEVLASIPIGENVTVRPGRSMVKFLTDGRVYAVAPDGVLRWVSGEALARLLYGDMWNRKILDISDAFFGDYRQGNTLEDADVDRAGGN